MKRSHWLSQQCRWRRWFGKTPKLAAMLSGVLFAVSLPYWFASNSVAPWLFVGAIFAVLAICIARKSPRDSAMFLVSLAIAGAFGVICRHVLLDWVAAHGVLGFLFKGKPGGLLAMLLLVVLPATVVFFATWCIGLALLDAKRQRSTCRPASHGKQASPAKER